MTRVSWSTDGCPLDRREDAQRDPDEDAHGHGDDGQLDRRRKGLAEVEPDRLPGGDGDTEVPADEVPEIDAVLLGERAVEAPLVPERRHDRRVRRRLLPQARGDRVGGYGVRQEEREQA